MLAVARFEEFKSPNWSFSVERTHFLPGVLLNLFNLAKIKEHFGSADDLKTQTNK